MHKKRKSILISCISITIFYIVIWLYVFNYRFSFEYLMLFIILNATFHLQIYKKNKIGRSVFLLAIIIELVIFLKITNIHLILWMNITHNTKVNLINKFDKEILVIVHYTHIRESYIRNVIDKQSFKNVIFWNSSMISPNINNLELLKNKQSSFYRHQNLRVMRYLQNITTYNWALVLEDDAQFYPEFKSNLMRYLNNDADVIWLDTRTSITLFTLGYPAVGTVGVLYNMQSINQFIQIYSEFYETNDFLKTKLRTELDERLAIFCKYNIIKCSTIPLIKECGFKTTLGKGIRGIQYN